MHEAGAIREPVGGHQPWAIGDAIAVGWEGLRRARGMLVLIRVVLVAALVLTAAVASAPVWPKDRLLPGVVSLARALHLPPSVPVMAGALLGWWVCAYVFAGFAHGLALVARGEPASAASLLGRARHVPRLALFMALERALALVCLIPLAGWALVPLRCGLLLTPFFIVDQELSLRQAMRASLRVTTGHKGAIFLYSLTGIPLTICGLAAFGVGYFPATTVYWGGLAYVYSRLSGRSSRPAFHPEHGAPYVRALPKIALVSFVVLFAVLVVWVLRLPEIRGSAWSIGDTLVRVAAVLAGAGVTVSLLGASLPWILDRLEGRAFVSFVAARHVRSQKSGFLTVISVLSIGGVAMSSCTLSSVVSVMGGFGQDLKRKILGNNAHVVIDMEAQTPWEDYEGALSRLRGVRGVAGASPMVHGEVMISSASNLAGVLVRGVDPETVTTVIEIAKNVEVGTLDYLAAPEKLVHLPPNEVICLGPGGEQYLKGPDLRSVPEDIDPKVKDVLAEPPRKPGIVLGRELAKTLHVCVGDEVTLVSPLGDLGPMGVMPRTKAFRVAAIFFSGMYEYDANQVYITLPEAQSYFGLGDKVSAIDVRLSDAEAADREVPSLSSALARKELRLRSWREMNKNLFSALKLERIATFVVLIIAIIVASFCIISTLLLMVTEKAKEIAILKAIGAKDGDIMTTFMAEGILIGSIGTVFGIVTALALCTGLMWFGVRLDPDVYYIDRLPISVSGLDFLLVTVAAVIICTLATLPPARSAASLRPVDGLRYE